MQSGIPRASGKKQTKNSLTSGNIPAPAGFPLATDIRTVVNDVNDRLSHRTLKTTYFSASLSRLSPRRRASCDVRTISVRPTTSLDIPEVRALCSSRGGTLSRPCLSLKGTSHIGTPRSSRDVPLLHSPCSCCAGRFRRGFPVPGTCAESNPAAI